MDTNLTEKEEKKLTNMFKKNQTQAEKIMKEPSKVSEVVNSAILKAKEFKGPLEKVWDQLQLFFGIVPDFIKGKYKEVPVGSIVAIVAALIYLVSPADLIPDLIPGIGLFDDLFIIKMCINQVGADLQKYKQWKLAQTTYQLEEDIIEMIE